MIFDDYKKTKLIYHVANINDLKNILENGISYNDKSTYKSKYYEFHKFIDTYKIQEIPKWIVRRKAIFGSMNFNDKHTFHSHSAVLGININPEMCWIANENLVNEIYEPFILKNIKEFNYMNKYIESIGIQNIKEYWNTSLSFKDNIILRKDKEVGYDCEVLIFHDVKPKDIKLISIVSDHRYIKNIDLKNTYSIKGEDD